MSFADVQELRDLFAKAKSSGLKDPAKAYDIDAAAFKTNTRVLRAMKQKEMTQRLLQERLEITNDEIWVEVQPPAFA